MRQCNVVVQFCLAHLIRDIKFLTTLPDARDRSYGERLRKKVRKLFQIIHLRDQLMPGGFQGWLQEARQELVQAATYDSIYQQIQERKDYPLPKPEIPGGGGKSRMAQGQTKKPDAHSHAKHK